jgi:homoserine kinase
MCRVRAFAPATVSNLGPGFDILGLALERPGDIVEAETRVEPGVEIAEVTGASVLSNDPARNVAGVAAAAALRHLDGRAPGAQATPTRGVRLWLHKQMPLASGLGSSAASSVAGALAASAAYGSTLSKQELIACALEGERAASGAAHADNVAPSALGGIVLIRSYQPLDLISLPVPAALRVVVVHPHCEVVTAEARKLVSAHRFDIRQVVANLGNVASLVDALYRGDLDQLGRSISDALVEPLRAPLVPGFDAVKQAALDAGARGCSLSGSGPSVFAFAESDTAATRIGEAMRAAFRSQAHLDSDVYVGPVNRQGATVL